MLTEVLRESVESESVGLFQPTLSSVWDYVFPRGQTCAHSHPGGPWQPWGGFVFGLGVVVMVDHIAWRPWDMRWRNSWDFNLVFGDFFWCACPFGLAPASEFHFGIMYILLGLLVDSQIWVPTCHFGFLRWVSGSNCWACSVFSPSSEICWLTGRLLGSCWVSGFLPVWEAWNPMQGEGNQAINQIKAMPCGGTRGRAEVEEAGCLISQTHQPLWEFFGP